MLIGGPERRFIELVEHDPAWAGRFERERARIRAALGDRALRIDHVGSTAVPGLAAKPIVDIDVSVADPDDEDAVVPDLLAAGYVLRVRKPGHLMVRTPARDVHVHVCAAGGTWESRHLVFRDWLREHPEDRRRYEDVKRSLAGREWADMNDYADAKTDVIAAIMDRASGPDRDRRGTSSAS